MRVSWDNEYQTDTFASIPETKDPQANVGTIGDRVVALSSSGNFNDSLEFEAFGGGSQNGWRSSALTQATPVWYQINFLEPVPWLDRIFFESGSEGCYAARFMVQVSDDEKTWHTIKMANEQINGDYAITLGYK